MNYLILKRYVKRKKKPSRSMEELLIFVHFSLQNKLCQPNCEGVGFTKLDPTSFGWSNIWWTQKHAHLVVLTFLFAFDQKTSFCLRLGLLVFYCFPYLLVGSTACPDLYCYIWCDSTYAVFFSVNAVWLSFYPNYQPALIDQKTIFVYLKKKHFCLLRPKKMFLNNFLLNTFISKSIIRYIKKILSFELYL